MLLPQVDSQSSLTHLPSLAQISPLFSVTWPAMLHQTTPLFAFKPHTTHIKPIADTYLCGGDAAMCGAFPGKPRHSREKVPQNRQKVRHFSEIPRQFSEIPRHFPDAIPATSPASPIPRHGKAHEPATHPAPLHLQNRHTCPHPRHALFLILHLFSASNALLTKPLVEFLRFFFLLFMKLGIFAEILVFILSFRK